MAPLNHKILFLSDYKPFKDLNLALTTLCSSGGADKNVVVFDKNEEQIVATLKGHTKKVTSVIYHPSQVCFLYYQPVSFLQ